MGTLYRATGDVLGVSTGDALGGAMRRLLVRLLSWFCVDCDGLMWPWQDRCGPRHRTCKHAGDMRIYERNDYGVMWDCSYCGRSIDS